MMHGNSNIKKGKACLTFKWKYNINLHNYVWKIWCSWNTVLVQITYEKEGRCMYRGADKSLAWPGRKKATGTEDFDFDIPYL